MKIFLFAVDTGGAPWAANILAIFEKILNSPDGRGLRETDSWKKPEVENLGLRV